MRGPGWSEWVYRWRVGVRVASMRGRCACMCMCVSLRHTRHDMECSGVRMMLRLLGRVPRARRGNTCHEHHSALETRACIGDRERVPLGEGGGVGDLVRRRRAKPKDTIRACSKQGTVQDRSDRQTSCDIYMCIDRETRGPARPFRGVVAYPSPLSLGTPLRSRTHSLLALHRLSPVEYLSTNASPWRAASMARSRA